LEVRKNILVIDDEEETLKVIKKALSKSGYNVMTVNNGRDGLNILEKEDIEIVITDLKLPDIDGMEILNKTLKINPDIAVIMITAYGTIENAVNAMKIGAVDYILKPIDIYDLRLRVDKAISNKNMQKEIIYLRKEVGKKYGFKNIIGESKSMKEIYEKVMQIAPTKSNVLITGESGTGKELIAKAIHYNSPRKDKPFIPLNCAAISEGVLESELFGHEKGAFTGAIEKRLGKFELAHMGTIFLDEIGDIPLSIQVKLLRVLEEREFMRVGGTKTIRVDVRLIAATNSDLEKAVREKRFREDLYYRLKVVTIELPPLRERKEDIPLLVNHFINEFSRENNRRIDSIDKDVMEFFMSYDWPGNVRELKNTIENMVVMAKKNRLTLGDIPIYSKKDFNKDNYKIDFTPGMSLKDIEREAIRKTLINVNGNKTKAAKLLKIGLRTLQRKAKSLNLDN
jgi:DNA-binding NtrC family response regulator